LLVQLTNYEKKCERIKQSTGIYW